MKRLISTTLTVAMLVGAANAQVSNTPSTTNIKAPSNTNMVLSGTNKPAPTDFSKIFKSDSEKYSYAIGMTWAAGLKARLKGEEIDFDSAALMKGFMSVLDGTPATITEAQKSEVMTELNKVLGMKHEEKRKRQIEEVRLKNEKALADGSAFLVHNKALPGVVTLPSGLQYKVITAGEGESPKPTDEVSVNYRGTTIDGTEFDSSAKHGHPLVTRVHGGVIKGWSEALELMKPGAKWQIFVPSDLAYGTNAASAQIGPNSVLIFDIELVSVKSADVAAINPTAPPGVSQPAPSLPPTPLTSDIIKVPSAEEMKKGAKIETIKAEDLEKEKAKANQ